MIEEPARASNLAALLVRGVDQAEHLSGLLGAEAEALASGDPDAVHEAVLAKQEVLAEFDALGGALTDALRATGLDGSESLERWLADSPSGPIAGGLRRLVGALATCRHANARNGATVRSLSRHNRHLLSLVRGEPPATSLYDHDGRARQDPVTRYATSA